MLKSPASIVPWLVTLTLAAALAPGARGQTYQVNTQNVPQGGPANNSYTENLDFADVDGDGDWDAIFADGGDSGNDQNRLWINQGSAQGGTLGVFVDSTATRLPAFLDASRDVDFADVDNDGDPDLFISNSSQISNQSNRWWINMGGLQGGTAGFFQDQTQTRWVNLGVNNGSTFSSISPALALASGGYIDWSCDSALADLDNDGFLDVMQSSYGMLSDGNVPARIFLNDGQGVFEEFNPSQHQLSGTNIADGDPALWAEGTQQHDTLNTSGQFADVATVGMSVEMGDVDGDFDIDILHSEKFDLPRMFFNRSEENGGALGFRDVSSAVFQPNWSSGPGKYDQVFGDFDNDGDLDIYGMNWVNFCDVTLTNDGAGNFLSTPIANSCPRTTEPDFVDYDNDGDLDVFLPKLNGQERMMNNAGPGGAYAFSFVTGVLPFDNSLSWGSDACDVDGDGDYDLFVANGQGQPNDLLENVSGVADTFAPRIPSVEQAPDRAAGSDPTVVRAHVFDNTEMYLTGFNSTAIEFAVDAGAFTSVAMIWSGGQVFRGEIPGQLVGQISYRVRSSDPYGNTGLSPTLSFTAGPCSGGPLVYCTAKTNSCGGAPAIASSGLPSAAASSGFVITASGARANKSGLLLYSPNGRGNFPFNGGTLCIAPQGLRRSAAVVSIGGTPGPFCDASHQLDWNAFASGNAGGNPQAFLSAIGQEVNLQWWGRDSIANGSLVSDAIEYSVCP